MPARRPCRPLIIPLSCSRQCVSCPPRVAPAISPIQTLSPAKRGLISNPPEANGSFGTEKDTAQQLLDRGQSFDGKSRSWAVCGLAHLQPLPRCVLRQPHRRRRLAKDVTWQSIGVSIDKPDDFDVRVVVALHKHMKSIQMDGGTALAWQLVPLRVLVVMRAIVRSRCWTRILRRSASICTTGVTKGRHVGR